MPTELPGAPPQTFPAAMYETEQVSQVIITPAQLFAMDNTFGPGTFVPMTPFPGAKRAFILLEAEVNLQFQSIAFTTGTGNLSINTFGGFGLLLLNSADIKATNSVFSKPVPTAMYPSGTDARSGNGLQNGQLSLILSNAIHYAAGDGLIVVTIRYRPIFVQ